MHEVWIDAWFGARLLVLATVTVALGLWYGTGLRLFPLWALTRAAFQLAVVALLLRGVLEVPWTAAAFVLLMLSSASLTAMGRTRELWRGREAAVIGVVAGALVSLGAILLLHLADLEARYVVATGGIVIGNAMSAATLSGRNFLRAARARASEVEAWLSLGATPATAHREIGREAVRESLIPSLDQSKSTGLVTLPGAFVGALFGGASPADAAKFQLVVLAGVALAMTVTAIVVTTIAGRSPYVVDTHS
ncbi:MAG: UDP-glucose/iron transport system permease protein [Nocardioidaceae bacterium]|nr:UDP-glucose/iron transport system permease protein [Nocardioidaceae bacterium]